MLETEFRKQSSDGATSSIRKVCDMSFIARTFQTLIGEIKSISHELIQVEIVCLSFALQRGNRRSDPSDASFICLLSRKWEIAQI